jgi:2-methylcitrate dehydratase PrpD
LPVKLKDGRVLTKHVEHAIGSLARPMTDKDLEGKFRALATDILSATETEGLIRLCWSIDKSNDASEIARAAVPAAVPQARARVS